MQKTYDDLGVAVARKSLLDALKILKSPDELSEDELGVAIIRTEIALESNPNKQGNRTKN